MSTTTIPVEQEAPPSKRRRLLLVALLLVLVGAGVGVYLVVFAGSGEAEAVELVEGEIVALPAQTTTVGGPVPHHVRVALAVVLTEGQAPTVVGEKAPLLQDALLRELATMTPEQVLAPEGAQALRDALSVDAREIWGDDVVARVVLTEMLVTT